MTRNICYTKRTIGTVLISRVLYIRDVITTTDMPVRDK